MNKTQNTRELINKTLTDIMVRCMLNPENEDFYIGRLTIVGLNTLIETNKGMEHIYRDAYIKAKKAIENNKAQSMEE